MATTVNSSTVSQPTVALSKVVSTVTATAVDEPKATFSWQSGPIPLISTPDSQLQPSEQDQYTHAASEMALVHNCIIRGLNSIYIQSGHVPTHEHTNFVSFSFAVYQGLCAHHDGEEAHFFPELERITGETGLMECNIAGHRDFDTKFNAWGAWLQDCLSGAQTFTSTRNIQLMDAFIPPLSTHLHDEIPTIIALRRFGDGLDLQAMFEKEGQVVMGGMDKRCVLPVFFLNHDDGFEGGMHNFPPLPWAVKWVLKNVFGRSRSAWWKFSACGYDGKPREVLFRGQ